MEKQEYPKMIYKGGESKIVKDADEHKAAGKGWGESPNAEVEEEESDGEQTEEAADAKPAGKKKGLFGK